MQGGAKKVCAGVRSTRPGIRRAGWCVCRPSMVKRALLFFLFLTPACHNGPRSGSDAAGGDGLAAGGAGAFVGGTGGYPGPSGPGGNVAGPGGAGGGGPFLADASAFSPDATAMSVDAGACPFAMAGMACAPAGIFCAWSSDCVSRRCDCVAGNWACSERQMPCGGTCPSPQAAQCGDSCTGEASGCLCHCGGGGPNYGGCSCSGGRWQCSCGGR
jgi:hypothetical protein